MKRILNISYAAARLCKWKTCWSNWNVWFKYYLSVSCIL